MKTDLTISWIIIFVLVLILIQKCTNKKLNEPINTELQKELKSYRLKNNELVKSQEVLFASQKELEKSVIEKDVELKQMSDKFIKVSKVKVVSVKTSIPKLQMAFSEPIKPTEISYDTLVKKFGFERSGAFFDKWYELGYKVNQDSLTIEPFNTWTELKIVDGFKRKWFLGKKTYTSDIMFTNPYINTEKVQTYQVKIPVQWYETRTFNISVGLVGGYFLFKNK